MADAVIPEAAKVAAKRAFWRTTAQGYATSITASLVLSVVALLQDGTNWLAVVVAVVTAIVTPLAAGLAAYFNWLSKGIPGEYEDAAIEADTQGVLSKAYAAQVQKNQEGAVE